MTYTPRPMHYGLLANAPGPDKRPFFATSTGASKAADPREPRRAREHWRSRTDRTRPSLEAEGGTELLAP